jgi:hypothetical protein
MIYFAIKGIFAIFDLSMNFRCVPYLGITNSIRDITKIIKYFQFIFTTAVTEILLQHKIRWTKEYIFFQRTYFETIIMYIILLPSDTEFKQTISVFDHFERKMTLHNIKLR